MKENQPNSSTAHQKSMENPASNVVTHSQSAASNNIKGQQMANGYYSSSSTNAQSYYKNSKQPQAQQSQSSYSQSKQNSNLNSQMSTLNVHNHPHQTHIRQGNTSSLQHHNSGSSTLKMNNSQHMASHQAQSSKYESNFQNNQRPSAINSYQNNYSSAQNYSQAPNSSSLREIQNQSNSQKQLSQLKSGSGQSNNPQLNNSYAGLFKSTSNANLNRNDSSGNLNSAKHQLTSHLQQQKALFQQLDQSVSQMNMSRQEKENQISQKSSTQILEAHLKQQQQLISQTSNQPTSLLSSNAHHQSQSRQGPSSQISGAAVNNKVVTASIHLNIGNSSGGQRDQSDVRIEDMDSDSNRVPHTNQGSTNALYQYLKTKHLSQDHQQRAATQQEQQFLHHSNQGNAKIQTAQQTISRISSSNNTPSKVPNNKHSNLSNSLKKVQSFSQLNKTSNIKELSSLKKQQQQQLARNSQLSKSPPGLNQSLNFYPQAGLHNASSANIKLNLNESMNMTNLKIPAQEQNAQLKGGRGSQLQSKTQISKSQQKYNNQQHNQSISNNNNALTQNWMNSFLDHYDKTLKQQNNSSNKTASSNSVVRNQPQNSTQIQSTFQKFLNNSQQAQGSQGLQKQSSKTAISISLNKSQLPSSSTVNSAHLSNGPSSGKHQHVKSITSVLINQRRGSGIQQSNSQQSNSAAQSHSNNNGNNHSQINLNKSSNSINRINSNADQQQRGSNQNLNGTKNLKKNMSFLANANSSTGQINNQVNTSSTAYSSKQNSTQNTAQGLNSSKQQIMGGSTLISHNNHNQSVNAGQTSQSQQRMSVGQAGQKRNSQAVASNHNNSQSINPNQSQNFLRKKNDEGKFAQNSNHCQNLSITNQNIQLNKSLYNTTQNRGSSVEKNTVTVVASRYQTNLQPTNSSKGNHQNQSVIIHNTQGYAPNTRHNQSLVLNGLQNFKSMGTQDHNQMAFQFDELLKNLDRQIETQVNPAKKFHLDEDIQIEITPGDLDLENVSPSGSHNKKEMTHQRIQSNVTQINVGANEARQRYESLLQILNPQSSSSPAKQSTSSIHQDQEESQVLKIFTQIIDSVSNQHDSQSLSLIKDYLIREISRSRFNLQQNLAQTATQAQLIGEKYLKLKENYELERKKRSEAERQMHCLFEEFQKQEQLLATFKTEFKKLKASDLKNQTLIKQLYSINEQSQIDQAKLSHHHQSQMNHTSSKSNLIQGSNSSKLLDFLVKSQQQQKHERKPSKNEGLKQVGNNTIAFHSKNKSAALTVPKLDLSKIKKEIDQAEIQQIQKFHEIGNQDQDSDGLFESQQISNNLEDNFVVDDGNSENQELNQSQILAVDESNFFIPDADGNLDILKNQDQESDDSGEDSDHFILSELVNLKKSTIEVPDLNQSQLQANLQARSNSSMLLRRKQDCEMIQPNLIKKKSDLDAQQLAEEEIDLDEIRLVQNDAIIAQQRPPSNLLIPPLDFSKLKSNQTSSQQLIQAQHKYQKQVKQYQEAVVKQNRSGLVQSQLVPNNGNQTKAQILLNQSMSQIYNNRYSGVGGGGNSNLLSHSSSNNNLRINKQGTQGTSHQVGIYSHQQSNAAASRKSNGTSCSSNLNNSMSLIASSLSQSLILQPQKSLNESIKQDQRLMQKPAAVVPPLNLSNIAANIQITNQNFISQVQKQQHFPESQGAKTVSGGGNIGLGGGFGFKLDIDKVKQQSSIQGVTTGDGNNKIQCFQDEFMDKIDEFSQSWRIAALKEQRT